jgi:beta-carotene/zeaxanthin 4-ketolase
MKPVLVWKKSIEQTVSGTGRTCITSGKNMNGFPTYKWKGLLIAASILLLWSGALTLSLSLGVHGMPSAALPVFLLLNTFLYTGLFITAHDAMHGTVAPSMPKVNNAIGRVSTTLYALFSFPMLLRKHREHHRHPASSGDPDYHDGEHSGLFRWYLHFFFTYVTWKQLLGMAVVYNILIHLLHLPQIDVLLFWVAPALLSTFQLFYFGTYLPHREPADGYTEPHRAVSSGYGVLLSFLTCYHFGYHYEHHDTPGVPWWRLPGRREHRP